MTKADLAIVISAIAAVGGLSGWVVGLAALRQNRALSAQSDRIRQRLADVQEQLAAVEEARRRDELRPELTMTSAVDNTSRVLTIRNGDRSELDHVEVIAAIEAPEVIARGIKSMIGAYHSLSMGEALTMSVPVDDEKPGGLLVLKMRVRSGTDEWELAPSCDVEGSMPMGLGRRYAV